MDKTHPRPQAGAWSLPFPLTGQPISPTLLLNTPQPEEGIMEKDHLEILLEDIRGKFELVLEGHTVLRAEMHEFRRESNEKHDQTAFLLKKVATDLAAHRTDTEVHRCYKVSQ